MTGRARDLAALRDLAAMKLDLRLADLRQAAGRVEVCREELAALDRAAETAAAEADLAGAAVRGRYMRWCAQRRAELNIRLARETALWLAARAAAAQDFGRAEVLAALLRRKG